MADEVRRKIKEIMGEMTCPHDFACARSGFNRLCTVEDKGMESFLVCLECAGDAHPPCTFRLSFGYSYYCRCPLRVFLAKELNR